MLKWILVFTFTALLAACGAASPNLAEQAKTATLTYTAVTKNAQVILKSDVFSPAIETCIKAADTVAFNYQDELNLTAQEWLKAGAEDRKPLEDAFTNLDILFDAATMNLTNALTGKGAC